MSTIGGQELNTKHPKVRELENLFFHKCIPVLNKIVGLKPNNHFAVGLFYRLGVRFSVTEITEDMTEELQSIEAIEKANEEVTTYSQHGSELLFFRSRFIAFVLHKLEDKKTAVNIGLKYKNDEEIDRMIEFMKTDLGVLFVLFVYLHEVQHILRKHTTPSFSHMMLSIIRKHSDKYIREAGHQFELINIAEDYAINYSLEELFEQNNSYRNFMQDIKNTGMFSDEYKKQQLNEMQILEDLLKNQNDMLDKIEDLGNGTSLVEDGDGNKKVIFKRAGGDPSDNKDGEGEKDNEGNGKKSNQQKIEDTELSEKQQNELANSLSTHIDNTKKSNGSFSMGESIEKSIKTNVVWFDKLKTNLYNIVNRRTKKYTANWSNLNSKMRHIYKSPVKKNIDDRLDIVLSIDNSGSMSIESLAKLLYIIEKKVSKINRMTVLAHDTEIVGILENEKSAKKILDFVKERKAHGGTSHKAIFEYLDDNKKKLSSNIIYISFSDNYSDIEQEYNNYNLIKKVDKIWLNSEGRPVKGIPGTQVDIL